MVLFGSIVNTCEGVGKTRGIMTISDRDMRSERPEFERCAPVALMPRAKKKESKRKLIDYSGLLGSVVKPVTANAGFRVCLRHQRGMARTLDIEKRS
jgi:hypothetical protein